MATVKSLVREILFEKSELKLKIFYNIDVQLYPGDDIQATQEQPPVQQMPNTAEQPLPQEQLPPAPQQVPQQQLQQAFSKKVNEEIEKENVPQQPERFRSNGVLTLEKEDAYNIQTAEDLIGFLSDKVETNNKEEKKKQIFNDFLKETLVLVVTGAPMNEIIGKKDKIIVELDYGFDKDNSIGMKINKLSNVGSMSISMKRDDDIVPGPFNVASFNERILWYRNELNNPTMGDED